MELTAGLARLTIISDISKRERTNAFCGYIPYAWDRKYGTVLSVKPQGGAMLQRAAGCIFGAGNSGGDGAGVSKARAADV